MTKGLAFLVLACCILFSCASFAYGQQQPGGGEETPSLVEEPLKALKQELLSFVQPMSGRVLAVEDGAVTIDKGTLASVKPGMRFSVFKEGVSFIHPVTKEPLGRIEIPVGTVDVTTANRDDSRGVIVKGKPEDFQDAKVKIYGTRIRLFFFQSQTVDWDVGETYYQILKESGRFDLIDTGIVTDDMEGIMKEARDKGAEMIIMLRASAAGDQMNLAQRLLWAGDAKQFSDKEVSFPLTAVRELKYRAGRPLMREGEILLMFSLTFGASHLSVGDLDGDRSQEIILVSGNVVRAYVPGVDLKLLWEFNVSRTGDVLWIETADMNGNGRDEVIVTLMQDGRIVSSVHELTDGRFVELWNKKDLFLRKIDQGLVGQRFNQRDGYDGAVFSVSYENGTFREGDRVKLPAEINIYDYQPIISPDGRRGTLSWDENGFLQLHNERDVRVWMSAADYGGFSTTFKRDSVGGMAERGKWAVKDRLMKKQGEVLVPKKTPLVGMAKGIGFRKSEIRSLWWNGLSVDERRLVEDISGEILDYTIVEDKIYVLSKPLFGIKAGNILKGENPLGVMIYVFSLKGR